MTRKLKTIISLFLLLVFLLPSIIKLEHHHDHFVCKAKNVKHLHNFKEKCEVCNFEFSIFSLDFESTELLNEQPVDEYCFKYKSRNYSSFSEYSFLLRAPPIKQV